MCVCVCVCVCVVWCFYLQLTQKDDVIFYQHIVLVYSVCTQYVNITLGREWWVKGDPWAMNTYNGLIFYLFCYKILNYQPPTCKFTMLCVYKWYGCSDLTVMHCDLDVQYMPLYSFAFPSVRTFSLCGSTVHATWSMSTKSFIAGQALFVTDNSICGHGVIMYYMCVLMHMLVQSNHLTHSSSHSCLSPIPLPASHPFPFLPLTHSSSCLSPIPIPASPIPLPASHPFPFLPLTHSHSCLSPIPLPVLMTDVLQRADVEQVDKFQIKHDN